MASGLETTTKVRETRKKPTTMTSSRNRRDSCRAPRTSFEPGRSFIIVDWVPGAQVEETKVHL
jgi:hypothetical protein